MPILRKHTSAGRSMCLGVAGAGRRAGTVAAWYSATTRRAILSSLCSPTATRSTTLAFHGRSCSARSRGVK
eukprot:479152-Prymnesium_polylepis.1